MILAGSLLALRNAAAVAALPPTIFAPNRVTGPNPSEQQPQHPLQALSASADSRPSANPNAALQQLGPWSIAASAFQRTQQAAYSQLWPQYRMAAAAAANMDSQTSAAPAQRPASKSEHASAFMPFESAGFSTNAASTSGPAMQQLPGGEGGSNPHQQLFHAAAAASAAAAYAPYQLAAAAAMASSQMAELQRTLLQQRQAETLMAAVNAAAATSSQSNVKDQQDQPSSTTQDPATPSPRGKGSASKRRLGNRGKMNPYSIDSLLKSHGREDDDGEEEEELADEVGGESSSPEKKIKLEKADDDSDEGDQELSESPFPADKSSLLPSEHPSSAKKKLVFPSDEGLEKKTSPHDVEAAV